MKDTEVDAAAIAALLDGRLDQSSRSALLAQLAESDEARAVLGDAAALLRDIEVEEGRRGGAPSLVVSEPQRRDPSRDEAGVIPFPRPAAPVRWWRGWAVAASVAAIAAPWLWQSAHVRQAATPATIVAQLAGGVPGSVMPTTLLVSEPWSATRGVEAVLTPNARTVQLGARLVDLELAVRARDTSAARIAGELAALLDGVPASGAAIAIYRAVGQRAGTTPQSLEPLLEQGWGAVTPLVDDERLQLGAWLEAARAADARHAIAFLRSRGFGRALERAAETADLTPEQRTAIKRLELAASRTDSYAAAQAATTLLLALSR